MHSWTVRERNLHASTVVVLGSIEDGIGIKSLHSRKVHHGNCSARNVPRPGGREYLCGVFFAFKSNQTFQAESLRSGIAAIDVSQER
jgi:hypothetical protein